MNMDFSGANPNGQMGGNELLPKGALVWCNVAVRPFNVDKGMIETPSKSTQGNAYLDLELTILDGPYARRKIWDRPGVKGGENYVQAGLAAIRHILEVGRNASPQNQAGYQIADYMALDGLTCAVKIGIDKGKDGYDDKNTVARYLSPNPESDTHTDFERLRNGDAAPAAKAPASAAQSNPAKPAWGPNASTTAKPTAPTPAPSTVMQPQPGAKPAWLTNRATTLS